MITNKLETIEGVAVDLVAKVAPWCAPIPTAYLVGRATVLHLGWPGWVGFVAAIIVETLGLASTSTALELYQYNQDRRKSDPGAPFVLAAALVLAYFMVATGLTVALDIFPGLAVYSPAIFPALSLTGVTVLALRSDQRRRLAGIAQDRAERREARQVHKETAQFTRPTGAQGGAQFVRQNAQGSAQINAIDAINATRQARRDALLDALLDAYSSNPELGATEAARLLGVHRNTIYNYTDELMGAGRLSRNGHGWEVRQ